MIDPLNDLQLKEKHGTTWDAFTKQYRGLVCRIQKRYGAQASAPFHVGQINRFLDRKEREYRPRVT